MFNLDEEYLRSLGMADLPEDLKQPLLAEFEKILQDRISLKMAQGLTDEQLEAFAAVNEQPDGEAKEKAQTEWLEANVPNYKKIIEETLIEVRDEIKNQREQVL